MITEDTAQTGPSTFLVDGEPIGFFETSESAGDFYNYEQNTSNTPPNAVGLKDFGIDTEPSVKTTYVYIHHSTETDTYSLGVWHYQDLEDETGGMRITVKGSSDHFKNPGSPLVEDDAEGSGGGAEDDLYGTNSDGDAYADHLIGSWHNGDGVVWGIEEGVYTLEFEYGPSQQDTSATRSDQVIFRGPDGDLKEQLSDTGTFDFSIAFS